MTSDARDALIKAHQSNIDRHRLLLASQLTDQERDSLHRRIAEERGKLARLLKAAADDILPGDPERGVCQ